jgi:hypothetical protein
VCVAVAPAFNVFSARSRPHEKRKNLMQIIRFMNDLYPRRLMKLKIFLLGAVY